MRYAAIKENDIVDGEGVCLSFWTQGCPHHCPECHNPDTWDFSGGQEYTAETEDKLFSLINKNGIRRNLSILGGEPLCPENIAEISKLVADFKDRLSYIRIFVWTGYTLEELQARKDEYTDAVLANIDVLIDGRYEKDKRDITLYLRGSSNQRVLYRGKDF